MSDTVPADPRAVGNKGIPNSPKLIDPKTSSRLDAEEYRSITQRYLIHPGGRPYTLEDLQQSNAAHAKLLEQQHVWRFQWPDGSARELSWKGIGTASTAETYASYFHLRLLGELRNDSTPPAEPPLTPPPLVQAPSSKPEVQSKPKAKPRPQPPPGTTSTERGIKDSRPTAQQRIGGPVPPSQPRPTPRRAPVVSVPEESLGDQIIEYMKEDFVHTTMTESMPLISKWFGRVGDVLEKIPPLSGVGKAYKMIAEIADAANLLYELVHEMKQAEALEKGGKEVVKRTKPAKLVAEKILKKKYPAMPEPVRKKIAGELEDLFEKYVSDPAIKKGRETMEKMDKDKELQRPLIEELKSIQKMIQFSL